MGSLQDDIIKYKKGELSPKEMHALEKKALSDPFLAEALEGMENISSQNLNADVEALNRKILKKNKTVLFTPLRIAAGVILISASVFVLNQLAPKQKTIVLKTEKPTASSPKAESQKQEEKKEVDDDKVSTKPVGAVGEQPKQERQNAPSTKVVEKKKGKTTSDRIVEPAVEQPLIAKTEIVRTEKKVEEVSAAPEEKAVVATESSKEIQPKQDFKAEVVANSQTNKKSKSEENRAEIPGYISSGSRPISGKVVSAEDGAALPGVNVVIKGTTVGTVTDTDGKFMLQNTSKNQPLVFSFIGLQTQEVNVEGKDDVKVALKNDLTQLSEVVVTALGVSKDNNEELIIHRAEPVGGLRAYNKYLDDSVRYPEVALKIKVKGKVKVEFAVHSDGSLDEFKVVKSLGSGCDEEVIRLIKEGPKWMAGTENGKPVESTVLVGVKFDPAKAGSHR